MIFEQKKLGKLDRLDQLSELGGHLGWQNSEEKAMKQEQIIYL